MKIKHHFYFSLTLFSFLIVLPKPVKAWAKEGHEIIARITRHYLSTATRDSVQKYLGAIDFESASTWMDDVRQERAFSHLRSWHYLNFEKDQTYVSTEVPNILNQLELVIYALRTADRSDRESMCFNLKVLFHLVGDLHQPLHVAYAVDEGGTKHFVNYKSGSTNLHEVWDKFIIQSEHINSDACLVIPFNSRQQTPIKNGNKKLKPVSQDPVDWMKASRSLLENVYDFKGGVIDAAYIKRAVPLIQVQLHNAGLNLARTLQTIFSKTD